MSLHAIGDRATSFVVAIVRNAREDDLMGEAAKMAFFLFLSLFPLILVVLALTGLIGSAQSFAFLTDAAKTTMPDYAWQFVQGLIGEVTDRRRPGTLSFGIVFALWAASTGVAALMNGLNSMYDIDDARPWWKRRLIALGVLTGSVILLVAGTAAFIPATESLIGKDVMAIWQPARWPLTFVSLAAAAWLAYYFLPARDQSASLRNTLLGACVASALWLVTALVFGAYVANIGQYGRVYGTVGAVIVLMLWFYLASLTVLIGGELAATLESGRWRRRRKR